LGFVRFEADEPDPPLEVLVAPVVLDEPPDEAVAVWDDILNTAETE